MRFYFLIVSLFVFLSVNSQNLVVNPSFEDVNTIPCGLSIFYSDFNDAVSDWQMVTNGRATVYSNNVSQGCLNHPNSTNPSAYGQQNPHTGDNFISLQLYGNNVTFGNNYREYVQIPLSTPLEVSHKYYFEYYVSLADKSKFASNNFGLLFTMDEFSNYFFSSVLNYQPQVEYPAIVTNTQNWEKISGFFVADSAYSYLTMGNFSNAAQTSTTVNNNSGGIGLNEAIYFVDDIVVRDSTCLIPSPDVVICPGDSALLYYFSEFGGVWSLDSLNTENPLETNDSVWVSPDTTTTYYIVTPCETSSVTVTVIQDLSPIIDDVEICAGEFHIYNLPNIDQVEYEWYNGSTSLTHPVTDEGWVWVTVTTPCEEFIDSAFVTVKAMPEIEPIQDYYLCPGEDSMLVIDATNYEYAQWQNGLVSDSILTVPGGTYSVTLYNGECSIVHEFDVINYDDYQLNLGHDAIICPGSNLLVDFSQHNGTFEWSDGTTGPVFHTNDTGYIWLHYIHPPCVDQWDTMHVAYFEPEIDIPDTIVCPKTTVPYNLSDVINTKIVWNGETESEYYTVTTPGTYWVEVFFQDCSVIDTFEVKHFPLPYFNVDDSVEVCQIDEGVLTILNADSAESIKWNTGETTPSINVNGDASYSVQIIDKNFCVHHLSIFIAECLDLDVPGLPNIFSPNGDGINDKLVPVEAEEIGWYRYEIYNRWGILVYEGDNEDDGWDGTTLDGKECNEGVYYFVFFHESDHFGGPTESPVKGNLELRR
jgi:gliding motility-associated-like protein